MVRLLAALLGLLSLADAQQYYTLRLPNGLQDELDQDEDANQHLRECQAQKGRDACLELLMQWGMQLVSRSSYGETPEQKAETARGWQFLKVTFQELQNDLKGSDSSQLQSRLLAHLDMNLKITDLHGIKGPAPVPFRDVALAYYFQVWDLLPARPAEFLQFRHKFDTGEQIKYLLRDRGRESEMSAEIANRALEFYRQAYRFHRLALPGGDSVTELPGWKATVREDMWLSVPAYVHLPGTVGIQPHRVLAHSDVEELLLLVRRLAQSGSVSQEILDQAEKSAETTTRAIKIEELSRWFHLADERRDREKEIQLCLEVVALQLQQGLIDEPREGLQFVWEQQHQTGDLLGWARTSVELSTHFIKSEKWPEALNLLQGAIKVLRQMPDVEYLKKAAGYEQMVLGKRNMPARDDSFDDFGKVVDYTAKLDPIMKETNRETRRDQLRTLLNEPGAPPFPKTIVFIALMNALQELRDNNAALRLGEEWMPEIKRWRGLPGQVSVSEAMIESDIDSGNLGRFYPDFAAYEVAARLLRGDDWLDATGVRLARVYLRLQDYRKASEMLAAHMHGDEEETVRDPMKTLARALGPYHDEDYLVQARIQLERGQKEEALATIDRLEKLTRDNGTGVKLSRDSLSIELAEVNAALGKQREALNQITPLVDGAKDPPLRAQALLDHSRISMALGEPVGLPVVEETTKRLMENPELAGEKAPDLGIFLADYYTQHGDLDNAAQHLKSALDFSTKTGFLDPQIIIHRKLGEAAMARNDLPTAIKEYRLSIALLDSVSQEIPSDVGKVGYRGELNKALPLLVEALYEAYRRSPTPEARGELIEAIEEGKARAISELLFPGAKRPGAEAALGNLQNSIEPGTGVVEFYMPETSDKVFRLILCRNTTEVQLLGVTAQELTERLDALRNQMLAVDSFSEAKFKSDAARLAGILFPKEWAATFESIPFARLYVVPAGPLHRFPFATLVDQHGHYLDDASALEVASLPSAAMLMRPAPSVSEARRSATFIGPAREKKQHEVLSAAGDLRPQLQQAIQSWRSGEFQWEQPLTAREFLDKVRNLDNVFLYAHARFLPDDPMSSYIAFGGATESASQLTAADILQTKVGNGLWVLTACSSGGGRVRSGDEVLGLPRALLLAGAGMTVITLWDVDAETSFDIMVRFYSSLAKGASVAGALREARSFARKSGLTPYDWAPFVLIGNHGFRD